MPMQFVDTHDAPDTRLLAAVATATHMTAVLTTVSGTVYTVHTRAGVNKVVRVAPNSEPVVFTDMTLSIDSIDRLHITDGGRTLCRSTCVNSVYVIEN